MAHKSGAAIWALMSTRPKKVAPARLGPTAERRGVTYICHGLYLARVLQSQSLCR
jgi:hypothetical protein